MFHLVLAVLFVVIAPEAACADAEDWSQIEQAADSNPRQVIKEAEQALRLSQRSGDGSAQVVALLRLAAAHDRLGTLTKALEYTERGLALARETGNADVLCWFLTTRALLKTFDRQDVESTALYAEATALAKGGGLPMCQARVFLNQGDSFFRLGRNADAMALLSKAYTEFEAQRDPYQMALALIAIGNLHIRPDASPQDISRAIQYFQRALALVDSQRMRSLASIAGHNLGVAFHRLKDFAEARRSWEQGLAHAREAKLTEGVAVSELRLGQLDRDERKFAAALSHLDAALPLLVEGGNQRFVFTTQLARAEVLAHLTRRREGLVALASAKELLGQLNDPDADIDYHARAAEIQARFGDYAQAYRHMEALRETDRRLAQTANTQLAEELKVRFEVQLKEAENARLRAQQREAEARSAADAEARRVILIVAVAGVLLLGSLAFMMRQRAAASRTQAAHDRALAAADAERAAALGEANLTLQKLAMAGQEITATLDAQTVFQVLHRHAGSLLDLSLLAIWWIDGAELEQRFGVRDGSPLQRQRIPLADPVSDAARSVRERREVLSTLASGKEDPAAIPGAPPLQSALFEPLVAGAEVLGVLSIQSAKQEAYGARERQIARTLSAYGAVALANVANASRLIAIEAELEHARMQQVLVHAGKMVAVGRLATGVAHEMSHPVIAIGAMVDNAQTLFKAGRMGEAAAAVGKVTREVARLTGLLRRIKSFSRAGPPRIIPLTLRAVLDDARQLFAPRLAFDAIDYRDAVDPILVCADPEQLSLAIANLVFNAADAVRDATNKRIEITARVSDGVVALAVRDNGTGISPEALPRLFEPFFTTKPEGEGLGLGLSLSVEALAMMNGRIEAANHPEGGAVFTVVLPLAQAENNAEATHF